MTASFEVGVVSDSLAATSKQVIDTMVQSANCAISCEARTVGSVLSGGMHSVLHLNTDPLNIGQVDIE